MNIKLNKKIIIMFITLVLLLTISFATAYFTGKLTSKDEHIEVIAKDISVIFTDDLEIQNDDLVPGWKTSKTFRVKNESGKVFNYNIIFENLINTFKSTGFLKYKITSSDPGAYNMTDYIDIPKRETAGNEVLAYDISIESDKTHEYTIYFVYENSYSVNQSDLDSGAILSGNLAIEEGTEDPINKRVTITVENGEVDTNTKMVTVNESVEFRVTPDTGYTTSNAEITGEGCPESLTENKLIITDVTKNTKCNIVLKKFTIANIMQEQSQGQRQHFDKIVPDTSGDNSGVYEETGSYIEDGAEDKVYYYSGNVDNNWVKFAGYYWRIIRTNEDGSVRLLYAGDRPDTTYALIATDQVYNDKYSNAMYAGYMYGNEDNNRGNTTPSPIKIKIDDWYETNIEGQTDDNENNWSNYVSKTAIYCNDRASDESTNRPGVLINYASYTRLSENRRPSYKCGMNTNQEQIDLYDNADIADKFTGSETTGNGDLTYPIALITADEIVYAGGSYGGQNDQAYYYLNSIGNPITSGIWWWTMSLNYFNGSTSGILNVWGTTSPGTLGTVGVNDTKDSIRGIQGGGVRPVLSIKACATLNENPNPEQEYGIADNPYEFSIDDTCANAEN